MNVDILPWNTPNFVLAKTGPRTRQEGIINPPSWHLRDVDAETLSKMCDDFRADIFFKAEKKDPRA